MFMYGKRKLFFGLDIYTWLTVCHKSAFCDIHTCTCMNAVILLADMCCQNTMIPSTELDGWLHLLTVM